MTLYAVILISSFVFLTGSALWALRWAVRERQFERNERAALLIFTEEEPAGRLSDHFPGRPAPRAEDP